MTNSGATLDEKPKQSHPLCPVCQTPAHSNQGLLRCPACHSIYHADCWKENGGCGVYGCSQVPATENRQGLEIPASYWGAEKKPCPRCGKSIQAAAVRCLHCGARFDSARPESTAEYRAKQAISSQLPLIQKAATWLFVFSVVPMTAPFSAAIAGYWISQNRTALQSVPSLYRALAILAILVGAGQTALIVTMVLLFSLVGGG